MKRRSCECCKKGWGLGLRAEGCNGPAIHFSFEISFDCVAQDGWQKLN